MNHDLHRATIPTAERNIADRAIEALQDLLGPENAKIVVEHEPHLPNGRIADLILKFAVDDQPHTYLGEVKNVRRAETLAAAHNQIAALTQGQFPGLLITPRLTPELARACRNLNLQFIDTAGNAYLRGPGLLIQVTGQAGNPADDLTTAPRGLDTYAALRLAFALLCHPQTYLNAPYRDLVAATGVALGTVGVALEDLKQRGLMIGGQGRGAKRHLTEPARLIEEWTTNYPTKLRPTLAPKKFTAADPNWWRDLDPTQYQAVWGGEVAANRLTNYLQPAACTLYLRDVPEQADNIRKLVVAGRLRKDPNGKVELLNAFWNFPDDKAHPGIAPPLLVYADLMATLDPRNLDVAAKIRDAYIDPVFAPT